MLAAIVTSMTSDNRSKRIKLSEFEAGLVSGKYNDRNVHEVVFGMTQITFQNMSQEEANSLEKIVGGEQGKVQRSQPGKPARGARRG